MAALDAADWTVTITDREIVGKKRISRGTLALGGTDTYPDGGVPLPAIALFGLERNLSELRLVGQDAQDNSYVAQVDYANHKLQLFEEEAAAAGGPLLEADTSEVPGPRTFDFVAVGW